MFPLQRIMMQQRQFLEAIVYTDRAEAILGEN
jgi:hypothetical protein